MPASASRLLGGGKKDRSDAVSCTIRVNADLLDVEAAVEHLQPNEAEGDILLVHGDQEPAVFQGGPVGVGLGRGRVGYPVHAGSAKQLVT
jgi:hypothetical protein